MKKELLDLNTIECEKLAIELKYLIEKDYLAVKKGSKLNYKLLLSKNKLYKVLTGEYCGILRGLGVDYSDTNQAIVSVIVTKDGEKLGDVFFDDDEWRFIISDIDLTLRCFGDYEYNGRIVTDSELASAANKLYKCGTGKDHMNWQEYIDRLVRNEVKPKR